MCVFSIIVITSFYFILQPKLSLPIYSPSMVSEELVEEDIRYVKKYHVINNFSLTNQNGKKITEKNYNNKIYVADFFFTTCPTICPIMTDNMTYLQEKLLLNKDVLLVSFSVTPGIDNVEVLKNYALEKGDNTKVDDC